MNRIHTISVPYAVMKACPLSWVQRVHIHKGNRSPEAPVWLKPTNMVVSVAEQLGSLWWNVATCTGPWWLIGSRGTSAWRRYGCSSLLMVQIPVSVPDSRFIHINFNYSKCSFLSFCRVRLLLRRLPKCLSVSRAEAGGHLPLCHVPRGHDSRHPQVSHHSRFMESFIVYETQNKNEDHQ